MIPDPEDGGRSGTKLYKELCDPVRRTSPVFVTLDSYTARKIRANDYPWAARHTWQSWMSYYKRHTRQVDAAIAEELKRFPRDPYHRGEFRWSRKETKKNQTTLQVLRVTKEESDDGESNVEPPSKY